MKKSTKRMIALMLSAAIAFSLTACQGGSTTASTTAAAAQKQEADAKPAAGETKAEKAAVPDVTLIAAHVNNEESSYQYGLEQFRDKLEELSGGTMTVEIHPNGELGGDESELIEKVASNTVDVIIVSPGDLSNAVPQVDFLALPYNEVYSGLQNNVIDAAENDIANIMSMKFYEPAPYVTLTRHDYATRFLVIGAGKYNSLTDEQKAWVDEASEYSSTLQWKYDESYADDCRAELEKEGVAFIDVDTSEWVLTVEPILKEIADKLGVADGYQAILDMK